MSIGARSFSSLQLERRGDRGVVGSNAGLKVLRGEPWVWPLCDWAKATPVHSVFFIHKYSDGSYYFRTFARKFYKIHTYARNGMVS